MSGTQNLRDANETVAILYWGRRGGGAELASDLLEAAETTLIPTYFFGREISILERQSKFQILQITRWMKLRKNAIYDIKKLGITTLIIPMASPWDLFLGGKIATLGVRVTRIIHDATPHPGEFFPPRFWIRLLLKDATRIVVLSDYVKSRLSTLYNFESESIEKGFLPISISEKVIRKPRQDEKYQVLFIGRGKKYKGLKMLEKAWTYLENDNCTLTIAGLGHSLTQSQSSIKELRGWLSPTEMGQLLDSCDLVVLPYSEASQSGIISLAHSHGKPVVVTPVGGLSEQVNVGVDGLVSPDLSAKSFSETIRLAINTEWKGISTQSNRSAEALLKVCLGI